MKNGIVMVVLCLATLQMVSAQEPQTEVATDTATKTIELNEVVVKSLLPKTRVSGDAMRTFIVGSSLETAGTATDLLGKLPMLKAEKGEGVEVFGRGQAEVYINGRKVQDMNELDRLRSEDILHVDVITSPGARYAATTKAVVRITTKKKQGDGWSFVEELSGYYQYGLSGANNLTVNFRTGNLDITGSLWCSSYGHSRGNSPSNLFYLVGDDVYVGRSTQDIKNRWNCYAPQLQFNYMINENHSFGAYYKWDYSPKDLRNGWFLMNNEKNGVLAESMLSDIVKESNYSNHLFNAYYNGKVRQLSIDWNIDGLFGKELEKSTTVETVTYYEDVLQQKNEVHNQTNYRNSFLATKL
ncbi:MAG: hypothetical protein Q4D14_06600, partial [Bacteroidales bacterium]|nr:hypothetical protein [Bacteroidales bacterium]